MVDMLITGGDVIDGSGRPRQRADVAITGDRITEIGDLSGATADKVIDATGKIVSPGFVDVHTHLDAQVFWDSTLSPSPLHGVTTVIGGNCGFTIAPLSDNADDADYLMRMLARVEGMPLASLQQGVPWNWKSTAEYLDAVDTGLSINAAFKVGHSALRRVVMGPDATKRAATREELDAMKMLLAQGLEAGGLGFSSSWSRTHNGPDGRMVPSRYGEREELIELCSVLSDFEGTSIEFIPCVGPFEEWATELMADMSAAAQSPLNWNVMNVSARTQDDCYEKLKAADIAAARGGKVVALTVPMTISLRLNFDSGFVLDALPEWENFILLSTPEKLEILADPAERKRLDDLSQQDGPMRNVAHWRTKHIWHTESPEHAPFIGRTVGEMADEQGKSPWDALCDMAVADGLKASFGNVAASESDADWKARADVWRDGRAVIGASDAGAHLDLFLTSHYTTELMAKAVRQQGLMDTEEAVHLMTDVPARLYGLRDRGRLDRGAYADVVVFDEATVGAKDIGFRTDLPADGTRLYAESTGISNVVCNGGEIVRNNEFTNARPGGVLRSGQHTADPDMS